jgi:hypothetical protein
MTLLQFYIGIRSVFVKSTCRRAAAELAPTPHRPAGNRQAAPRATRCTPLAPTDAGEARP